jgi:hypothetical protein
MTGRAASRALVVLAAATLSGCSGGLDTSYGHSRGESINGTGTVAEMFRSRRPRFAPPCG